MTDSNQTPKITIAESCPKVWGELVGSDQKRFCSQCQKHVVNGEDMTQVQVMDLIRESQGTICMRLVTDEMGTIVYKAAPQKKKPTSLVKRAGLAIAAGGLVAACHSTPKTPDRPDGAAVGGVVQSADPQAGVTDGDKPGVLLGEVCVDGEATPAVPEGPEGPAATPHETLGRIRLVPETNTSQGALDPETAPEPTSPPAKRHELLGTPGPGGPRHVPEDPETDSATKPVGSDTATPTTENN